MNEIERRLAGDNPISRKMQAVSSLFCLLAWQFSYPSKDEARIRTSYEYLENCQELLRQAAIEGVLLGEACLGFQKAAHQPTACKVDSLRVEFTKLFITPPRKIRMEGSYWVKNRTLLAAKKGEAYAVSQAYRQLGLVHKPDAKDTPDHIVSELDYLSYVTAAEAKAWEGNDVTSAREWKLIAETFLQSHLQELAEGVSSEIDRLSSNPFILFQSCLLKAVVQSCLCSPK